MNDFNLKLSFQFWETASNHIADVQSGLFSRPLCSPARLEISPDSFSGTRRKFRELSGARVDDGLNLLLRLLRDRETSVEIFVDEKPDKHLE